MASRLWELARLFLKLGTISFGGPAVHIGLLEEEVVARRQWLSREHFLDLLGATYLIPGPNALEMAAHVGYQRAGLTGLVVASVCFTLPAAVITGALAWAYAQYGALPAVAPFLRGIQPAVLAVIFAAVFRLGKTAIGSWRSAAVAAGVAAAALAGGNEILALLAGSLVGVLWLRPGRPPDAGPDRDSGADKVDPDRTGDGGQERVGALAAAPAVPLLATAATAGAAAPLWQLALFFLKVGAVLYGTGYVLVAYLEGGLVRDYHWLDSRELIDAVAAGQITPGPLISTATFVGYLVAGVPGAIVATVAIALPGLLLVAVLSPHIAQLRRRAWAGRFLDGVSAASIGVTAAVTLTLARGALIDWQSVLIAVLAAAVLLLWKVSPAWLVLAGALAGRVLS